MGKSHIDSQFQTN